MFASDFSCFKPIKDNAIGSLVANGELCLYEASDGTCFLFKAEDMAKAIAITPCDVDAAIFHPESENPEEPLVTTFGCFINKCRIEDFKKKADFIETVNKYQQSEEEIEVSIISCEQAEAYLNKHHGCSCIPGQQIR
jgi:hypothetical protein